MKYLNAALTFVAILLIVICLRLAQIGQGNKALIYSNQQLEKAITGFSRQIDPLVKRFGR
jgi:hypothetical protein